MRFTWLAEIGKLLFMFFVGFEIDLAPFNSTRSRAVVFGILTFTIPLTAGILLGRAFGYPLTRCSSRPSSSPPASSSTSRS